MSACVIFFSVFEQLVVFLICQVVCFYWLLSLIIYFRKLYSYSYILDVVIFFPRFTFAYGKQLLKGLMTLVHCQLKLIQSWSSKLVFVNTDPFLICPSFKDIALWACHLKVWIHPVLKYPFTCWALNLVAPPAWETT